ncbi:MAG TPA: hypothetical protein VG370_09750 [Chloroflexota bacterium]|jgi:hypothetical protein|nr:hypothetical protein [Chloroflexota bacterium]
MRTRATRMLPDEHYGACTSRGDDTDNMEPRRLLDACSAVRPHGGAGTAERRRKFVGLPVDRIVVDAPEVEIRCVVPLTAAARRKPLLNVVDRAGRY